MGGKNSTKRRSSNDTGRQAYDQAGWERDFREIFSANLIDARPPPVASNPVRPPRTVRPVEQPSVQASVIHRPAATAPALTVRLPAVESYSGPERFRFLELTYPQGQLIGRWQGCRKNQHISGQLCLHD
ncbi:hypothetical protein HDE_09457 [Halotydeus destructor]|nr:hypothetical protein HDE_09457 [Halotydeus destructor]